MHIKLQSTIKLLLKGSLACSLQIAATVVNNICSVYSVNPKHHLNSKKKKLLKLETDVYWYFIIPQLLLTSKPLDIFHATNFFKLQLSHFGLQYLFLLNKCYACIS